MADKTETVPRLTEGVEVSKLSLGPQEAFVLSCVDGFLGVADIADLAGLPLKSVRAAIDKLAELGAISWEHKQEQPLYSQAELNEDVELDTKLKLQVLETFYRLDSLTHYEVLNVEEQADRQAIRQSYFQLSKKFHPDTLYGKQLGSYKGKMEVVFKRLTEAYEVLGKKKSREGYDRYLVSQKLIQTAEEKLFHGERKAEAIERAIKNASAPPPGRGQPAEEAKPSSPPEKEPSPKEKKRKRKRDLLMRRLRGAATKLPAHQLSDEYLKRGERDARADALARLTSSLKQTAKFTGGIDQVEKHLMGAKVAEADGDLIKAANALRMALALAPDRPDILPEYRRINGTLQAELLDTHRKQAEYEEEQKMFSAAAISWAKVTEGDPDNAGAPRRCAMALWQAGGDLRTARAYAQRALDLAPENVENRVLLARIYLGAKMDNSAKRELEEVVRVDPTHQIANNLLAKLSGK